MIAFRRLTAVGAVAAAFAGCNSSEVDNLPVRLFGQAVPLKEPIVACSKTAGFDISSLELIPLPDSAIHFLRESSSIIAQFPRRGRYEDGFEITPWKRGPLSADDYSILARIPTEIEYLKDAECVAGTPADVRLESMLSTIDSPENPRAFLIKASRESEAISVLQIYVADLEKRLLLSLYVDY